MNKKILSLIIALTLPLTFLVGCNNSSDDEFVMTESTTALDGSVEYSAKTYKEAFYSTENYSNEYLQKEFENIVNDITSEEDKEELLELLKSYSNTKDNDFDFIKSCFEKYNNQSENSQNITLNSNGITEISSRLYKATLNATKKYYDINDFYIYYKDKLLTSSNSKDDNFENEVRITTIKEYTIASIYKNAYNDSFISKLITSIENSSSSNESVIDTEDKAESSTQDDSKDNTESSTQDDSDNDKTPVDNNQNTDANNDDSNESNNSNGSDSDDTYPEYLELTEALKSQIYDAGVSSAIEFINQNTNSSSSAYCRQVYESLENDNPLGDNKEEGYNYFLEGFKTTLENNGVTFE